MHIRDRIVEFCRVRARDLRPHPKNWRTHPPRQRDALRGLLAEIGYAGALLARRLADGSLELIDGHLRAETTPDAEVPVLVVDLDEAEAAKLLALHDPLAGLAEADHEILAGLAAGVDTQSEAVRAVLEAMQGGPDLLPDAPEVQFPPEVPIPQTYQVVVECRDEAEQRAVYERMTAEGLKCRLMNL